MPYGNVPKNLWDKMDRCVEDVQEEQGVSKERAIAICHSSIVGKSDKSMFKRLVGRFKAVLPNEVKDYVHGSGGAFSSAGLENGGKDDVDQYECECLDCGYTFTSEGHCNEATCPECGSSDCRREDRPGTGEREFGSGIKAVEVGGDRYLVLWTSNAFKDREGEIFSTKAWEDYVARRDQSGRKDRVWFWHVKGSDFGDVVWQGMVGRMLVEIAKVDSTVRGDKMYHAITHPADFGDVVPHGWGTSHGYAYRKDDKSGGVYRFVEKFETTVLPKHRASNLFGGIKEVLDMGVTKEKEQALISLLGNDVAQEVLRDASKASNLLETLVDWKESSEDEDEEEEEEIVEGEDTTSEDIPLEEEEELEMKQVLGDEYFELELDEDLMSTIADYVDVKEQVQEAVSELIPAINARLEQAEKDITAIVSDAVGKVQVESKESIVKNAISGKLRLTPYSASQDADNTLPESEKEKIDAEMGGKQDDGDSPVSRIVQNMIRGV